MANTLAEYLSSVDGLRRKKWKMADHKELWFRAEDAAHASTHLQPGLYRPRDGAARKSIPDLLALENDLYEEFQRCAPQLNGHTVGDDWEAYFLMQHHGVPTRLLDWTDGALIALHFAVKNKTAPYKTGAVIHVIDPHWLVKLIDKHPSTKDAEKRWARFNKKHPYDTDEFKWDNLWLPEDEWDADTRLLRTPEVPLLWDSPHVSRRIAAQRSRFMIFGSDPLWLAKLAKKRTSRMSTIDIPASAIAQMQGALRDAGITESVIFPDLDGLGRELKQVWDARR